jgi:hypothetical protein
VGRAGQGGYKRHGGGKLANKHINELFATNSVRYDTLTILITLITLISLLTLITLITQITLRTPISLITRQIKVVCQGLALR